MSRSSLAAAAVLFIGAVSACSSGSTPAKAPGGGANAGQQGGVAAEPATAAGPPSAQRIAAVRKQLLGGGDITGYAAGGSAYDYTVDRPCLKPTMLSAFPQHEELVAQLAGRAGSYIGEHVIVFGDEPTARQAYAANVAEFGCPSGILRESDEALPVSISVPADVRAVVGAGQASTWTLDNPKHAHVIVVLAQVKDMVVNMSFSSDTEQTAVANPLGAAKIAIAKLVRA
jgi:hypothetical protein